MTDAEKMTALLKRKPPALIKLESIRARGKAWERGVTHTYFFSLSTLRT